jgi:superfamily II helicase
MRLLLIISISFAFFSCANNLDTLANIDNDLKNSAKDQEIECVYERITGSYIKKRVCYDKQLKITREMETRSAIRQMDIFPMHLEPFYQ